jgi:hypothetical protein
MLFEAKRQAFGSAIGHQEIAEGGCLHQLETPGVQPLAQLSAGLVEDHGLRPIHGIAGERLGIGFC